MYAKRGHNFDSVGAVGMPLLVIDTVDLIPRCRSWTLRVSGPEKPIILIEELEKPGRVGRMDRDRLGRPIERDDEG